MRGRVIASCQGSEGLTRVSGEESLGSLQRGVSKEFSRESQERKSLDESLKESLNCVSRDSQETLKRERVSRLNRSRSSEK